MKWRFLLCLAVAGISLSACKSEKRPVEVVRSFMAALEQFDAAAAEKLVCQAQRAQVRASLEPFGDATQFDLTFDELDIQELSNDGERAVVQVGGALTIVFLGQQETQPINETHIVIKESGHWVICNPN